jgi:hypothetical protein
MSGLIMEATSEDTEFVRLNIRFHTYKLLAMGEGAARWLNVSCFNADMLFTSPSPHTGREVDENVK